MRQQMLHQLECYGTFSSEIEDYTRLKIPQRMNTPKGEQLLGIVDPYSYRSAITIPKLVILGTNDPYWTVDSANLYFPDFPEPKYLCYQSNTKHDINPTGIGTLAEFFLTVKNQKTFPSVSWKISKSDTITVNWNNPQGTAYLWKADSDNRDFRNSKWESTQLKGEGKAKAKLKKPKTGWSAYYIEVRFPGSFGNSYSICTQMKVLPDKKYPFVIDKQNFTAVPVNSSAKK
jgi:PhoPQ-activated pathogenicity-related protein